MDETRIPFLATRDGKSDKIVRTLFQERTAARQARLDYMRARGVENLYGTDSTIVGLIVKSDSIPVGFRRDSKYGTDVDGYVCAVPDGRQKATFAAMRDELRRIPSLPGNWELDSRLGFSGFITGRCIRLISAEVVDDSVILSVPRMEQNQFVPPDCVQLKHSEYYALKEQAELATPSSR